MVIMNRISGDDGLRTSVFRQGEYMRLASKDDQEIKLVSWKLGFGFAGDLGTVS